MKANLFIVDDDANTLASLSRAFRLAGHEATVCDNPIKALEMIKAEKYDVIFSDVVMPTMNGLALLEQIKAGLKPNAYLVVAPPQSYFIDAKGVVHSRQIGELTAADLERQYAAIANP